MAQINLGRREVKCKIVYYGPGLSGKTTNIEQIYGKLPGEHKGQLTSIATEGDRTLFFDFLPIDIGSVRGMTTKFQIYTVPGQTFYRSTRKLVLQGADGVIFVADSGSDKLEENLRSLEDLQENLADHGLNLDQIPFVIQYNKRDLPGVLDVAVLQEKLNKLSVPHFEASALKGEGVIPTLKGLSRIVLDSLNKSSSGPSGGQVPPAVEELPVDVSGDAKTIEKPVPAMAAKTAVPLLVGAEFAARGAGKATALAAGKPVQTETGKAAVGASGKVVERNQASRAGAPVAPAGAARRTEPRSQAYPRPAARTASANRSSFDWAAKSNRQAERSVKVAAETKKRNNDTKKIIVLIVLAGIAAAAAASAFLL